MQFAIIETNEDIKVLIDFVSDSTEFKKLIYSKYPNAKTLDDITFRHLKYNVCFTEGTYLLHNNDKIEYVVKNSDLIKGYVYNSTKINTKILLSWRLIPSKLPTSFTSNLPTIYPSNLSQKNIIDSDLPIIDDINKKSNLNNDVSKQNLFSFKQFNVNNIKKIKQAKICFIGKKNSGKSLLVCNILDTFSNNLLVNCLIISPNNHGFYKKLYPYATISTTFNKNLIKEFVATHNNRIIVFDDYLINQTLWESKSILDLFDNSTFIATIQEPLKLNNNILDKFNYLIFTPESNIEIRKKLYDTFFKFIPSFDTFINIFFNITKNNNSLVIDMKHIENNTDKILYYNYKQKNH